MSEKHFSWLRFIRYILGIFAFFVLLGLMILVIGPCIMWSLAAIKGEVGLNPTEGVSYSDVITYAIGVLSLLVTIMALGIGVLALFGYYKISDSAKQKAIEIANKAIDEQNKTIHNEVGKKTTEELEAIKNEYTKVIESYNESLTQLQTWSERVDKKIEELNSLIIEQEADGSDENDSEVLETELPSEPEKAD